MLSGIAFSQKKKRVKMKILMVCIGNLLRSPMAAGILKNKLHKKDLNHIEVYSAGFESHHINQPADIRAIELMKSSGIDITDHVMRMFSAGDFEKFDKIYVMDSGAFKDITYFARNDEDLKKIEYLTNTIYPKKYQSIPDPAHCAEGTLHKVYSLIDKACDSLADELIKTQQK